MLKNKGLLTKIRSSRGFKGLCMLLALNLFFEIVQPTAALALTEGPSQPEVQSFEPIGTTDMVDVFSGDFNYNIPLFNLPGPNGGYPVNLAYHAGVSMDDEASWVGLGWNINPGSLVRNMRGLPDEFMSKEDGENAAADGDFLEVKSDMKGNMTVGSSFNTKFEIAGADLAGVGFSAAIYYNNYRGLGMSTDAGITWGAGDVQGGVGLSLDSDNGVGVNAQLSLTKRNAINDYEHKLEFSFDGNLSIDYQLSRSKISDAAEREAGYGEVNANDFEKTMSSKAGSSITFARSAFSPSLAFKMNKWNASFGLYGGFEAGYLYTGLGGSVFFNTEDLNDEDKKGRKHLVMGYDKVGSYTNVSHTKYSKDFSRERDGQIVATTPYLPVANYTYDAYTSTGQGLSGYFRPHRNDIGRVHDPEMRNNIYGGSLNMELGAGGLLKGGIQVNLNYGYTSQGAWGEQNDLITDFKHPSPNASTSLSNENLYYKMHGESTVLEASDINYKMNLELPQLKFLPKGTSGGGYPYGGKRYMDNSVSNYGDKSSSAPREKRNTTISNLKNSDVANLGEYQVYYYNWSTSLDLTTMPSNAFNRSARNGSDISSHYAGFKVLNEEGAHYVYGLPAYNNVEIDNLFSTDKDIPNNTYLTPIQTKDNEVDYKQYAKGHQYIRKVKKSPYAHSYLLTSVQGADYVDLDNNGPTDDDLGYWVKFSYVKKADNFKWRAPYDHSKAFFSKGASYTDEDDKASYNYGEKELWYVGRMETKTHIAIFKMSEREDMVEAAGEMSTTTDTILSDQKVPLKLDAIVIYDKQSFKTQGENARFLQKIVFTYDYELCENTSNSRASGVKGKMTLKEVAFMSNGSTRGALNTYKFDYFPPNPNGLPLADNHENPDYSLGSYDSWGVFKPRKEDEFANNFPYTNQFNQDWSVSKNWEPAYTNQVENRLTKSETKQDQDGLASAWCLRSITLPSGGVINVNYESDDYGYVQHKTANQMFKIASLGDPSNPGRIYANKSEDFEADPVKKRIYFKLEKPIPVNTTNEDQQAEMVFNDYVKPIHLENNERYLYFKTKMKLTANVKDYVSGYLPLEDAPKVGGINVYGVATSNMEGNSPTAMVDGVSCYTYGFVTVKSTRKIRKSSEKYSYHPMAIAGWTYLQTSAPELFQDQGGFSDDVTENNFMGKIGAFMNILPEMLNNWGGVKSYCAGKKFCSDIDRDYSCIRLASPDKIKFGGGHRVKEISINDNWGASTGGSNTDNRVYGQRYDYTIEENGKMISSGVAAYEPQAGGDENALKYPYFYAEKQNYFSKNNLFTEAPFNEELFPGPSVGYRKVSVTSINTGSQMDQKKIVDGGGSPAPVGRTGGVTEHYFYTAKEFPTMVEVSQLKEENSTLDCYNLLIPIPLIGSLKYNYYHGTQAFKIELNDMHGKPKAVKTYELNNYVKNPKPITETSYEYLCEPVSYMGEEVWKLKNEVPIIQNNDLHTPTATKYLGVEVDLFTDQRESKSFHVSAGMAFNVDMPPIPILSSITVWPSYSNTKQLFRTYVTNKVIHRSGILNKTVSRDLQSSNESEIMAYDEISGNPILVKTKNEFGDDFYNYSIPAYYQYDLMGHAYKNINYAFKANLSKDPEDCYYRFPAANEINNLVRGDELLVNGVKTYFLGWTYNNVQELEGMLHAPFGPISGILLGAELRVIRSGRRNHYATMAGNYLTKGSIADNGLSTVNFTMDDGGTYSQKGITKNVLSATASLYMDNWMDDVSGNYLATTFPYTDRNGVQQTASVETFTGDDLVNPYITGKAGIWRTYKSYTYVGKRKSSGLLAYNATDIDPKLRYDGVFDEVVPFFDWRIGLPEDAYYTGTSSNPMKNWEWTNEITRFNTDAYETENVNRLGIFSSALYGYDNSLSIGVGGNASLHELGVMDFETLGSTVKFGSTIKQNGLNFYNNTSSAPKKLLVTEQQNFYKAKYTAGELELFFKFKTDVEKDEFFNLMSTSMGINSNWPQTYQEMNYQDQSAGLENTFGISLVSKSLITNVPSKKGNQSFFFNGRLTGGVTDLSTPVVKMVSCKFKPYICSSKDVKSYLPENTYYYGKLTMLKKRTVLNLANESGVTAATAFIETGTDGMKAHSGKKMMKVNGSLMFEQQKFCFKPNKTYVLSMWVARTNQDVKTYQTSNLVQPIFINQTTLNWLLPPAPSANTTVSYQYGKVIEGWQKVDIEFNVADDGVFTNNIFAIRFNTGGTPLYVDDVRLSPKTGGLKTFVYDPVTFWLKASLNVDNYATFYHYDQQGALTLTKQETEKGIFTVSESRSRLKK